MEGPESPPPGRPREVGRRGKRSVDARLVRWSTGVLQRVGPRPQRAADAGAVRAPPLRGLVGWVAPRSSPRPAAPWLVAPGPREHASGCHCVSALRKRNSTRRGSSTRRRSLRLLLQRFSREASAILSDRAERLPKCPRTSPFALTLLQNGLHPGPIRNRRARHLPEPFWKLPRAEPNETGASQLEEMGRELGLVAAERNNLGDRFSTLRDDHFFARLDASQMLAQSRLELGHCRGPHQPPPIVMCM